MAIKRVHFQVHGKVQGVFFRVHTVAAAESHNITGYVRNLPSGKVEGEAQGEEEDIVKFLKDVDAGPKDATVVRVDRKDLELRDGEEGFRKIKWGQEPW